MSLSLSPAHRQSFKEISYGIAGAGASLTAGYAVLKGSQYTLNHYGIKVSHPPTPFRFFKQIDRITNSFLHALIKTASVLYLVIFVPIMEEWLFRDLIYNWQEREVESSRIFRVISNGILFGAIHFSVFYGWANVLVLSVTTVAGIIFASLREITGNRYASTIAHAINNAFVLSLNFLII